MDVIFTGHVTGSSTYDFITLISNWKWIFFMYDNKFVKRSLCSLLNWVAILHLWYGANGKRIVRHFRSKNVIIK